MVKGRTPTEKPWPSRLGLGTRQIPYFCKKKYEYGSRIKPALFPAPGKGT